MADINEAHFSLGLLAFWEAIVSLVLNSFCFKLKQ